MKVLVVGGGIAGLSTALHADAQGHEVVVVLKGGLGDGCTAAAQGGIAGLYGPEDSAAQHAADTLQAGDGHGDPAAVEALTAGAGEAIAWLMSRGVRFDLDDAGRLARGLEAAHGHARIAHAGGDATGAAISRALVASLRRRRRVVVRERTMLADLLLSDGRARGIRLVDGEELEADAVVLATGGAGRLYRHTTNPPGTTGDGIAAALRSGIAVDDLEFVQFHPTVLAVGEPFLVSEAVRGAGAALRDAEGRRFLTDEHPDAELAPRDVVARAVARRAAAQGTPVVLDATALGAEVLARRFPTIDRTLRARGIDWSRQPVPVMPAAHYLMGGVVTDLEGRTSLPGLFAVGETARTGIHGANRLASNSLLEGAVFGARVAGALEEPFPVPGAAPAADAATAPLVDATPLADRSALQQLMWDHVGLLRTDDGLAEAVGTLSRWRVDAHDQTSQEDANLLLVAQAAASAALRRTESLGAHHRAHRTAPALIGAR